MGEDAFGEKLAVIGAGIGGLAAAVGLCRAGCSCGVFEEAEELRLSGAAVTLWPNGAAALGKLGVPIEGLGQQLDRLETRSAAGRLLNAIDGRRLRRRFGHGVAIVPRRDILVRLAGMLEPERVRFGVRCEQVVNEGGAGSVVQFQTGTSMRCALVVGADGHRSAVRRSVFGGPQAAATGWAEWQGLVSTPTPLTDGAVSVIVVDRTGACGLLPAGGGLLQWWFAVPRIPDAQPPRSVVTMLRSRFGHWMEPIPAVLEALSDDTVNYWPYVRHQVPRSFVRGRVALLGDAAHAMPPTIGQGANQALEDATALAAAFATATIDDALQLYDRARRRRVAVVSRVALRPPALDTTRWTTRLSAVSPTSLSTWTLGTFLRATSSVLG